MKDVYLPMWFLRFSFFNPGIYRMCFFVGFCALWAIAYKIRATRLNNPFSAHLLRIFYAGMFWAGTNAFIFHPHYTNITSHLLALPLLITHIWMALFMLRRYGIGGDA